MLGVLEIIFRRDRIAGGLGVTRELEIFLRDVIGRSADLHVGAVGFIDPCQRVVAAAVIIVVVVVVVVVAPAHALVVMMLLTVSHGLLFNNSRLRRIRHSLPNLDRRLAGSKIQALAAAIHAVRPKCRAPSGDDLVASVLNILLGRGLAAAWLTFSSRALRDTPAMRSTGESFRIPMRRKSRFLERKFPHSPRPHRRLTELRSGPLWQCVTNLGSIP